MANATFPPRDIDIENIRWGKKHNWYTGASTITDEQAVKERAQRTNPTLSAQNFENIRWGKKMNWYTGAARIVSEQDTDKRGQKKSPSIPDIENIRWGKKYNWYTGSATITDEQAVEESQINAPNGISVH